MRTRSRRTATLAALVATTAALPMAEACKGEPPTSVGPATIAGYDAIAVVKIDTVELLGKEGRYAPRFRASGTVVKPLRGSLRVGQTIQAATSDDDGHGLCPMPVFKEGATHLVFLRGDASPYVIPRYDDLAAEESEQRFTEFVYAVETYNRVEARRSEIKRRESSGCSGGCSTAAPAPERAEVVVWLALAAAASLRRRR